ncbi:Os07g0540366, partial [Oryza sativa Japonica Group]
SIGGYDAEAKTMVATVELYEPRMPSWVMAEPMNYNRGYHSSAVLGGSIFAFGGVKGEGDAILDVGGTLQGRVWLGDYRVEVNWQEVLLLGHCSLTLNIDAVNLVSFLTREQQTDS